MQVQICEWTGQMLVRWEMMVSNISWSLWTNTLSTSLLLTPKEFVGSKMKDFCHLHHITLQIVTSYSHTIQTRVEGDIGIIKQNSRIDLSTFNTPTRFWPYDTTNFVYNRNYLW